MSMSESFGSSTPVRNTLGLGLSIICLRCLAYMDLARWDPYAYWLLQMGGLSRAVMVDVSVVLGVLVTP